ncbi:hypothetical protein [Catenulispora rubra]|nr:hypothetical protein [Catenulispora rubra]
MDTLDDGVLKRAAEEYAEQGFAIIGDVVPPEVLDEVRGHVD